MDIDDLIYVMAKQVDQYGTASDMEIVSCLTELKELRAKLAAMESKVAEKPAVVVPEDGRVFARYLSTEARIKWKQRWSKDCSANPDAMWTLFWESVSNDEAPLTAAPSHSQQSALTLEYLRQFLGLNNYRLIMFDDIWSLWSEGHKSETGQGTYDTLSFSGKTLGELELVVMTGTDRCPSHESEQ